MVFGEIQQSDMEMYFTVLEKFLSLFFSYSGVDFGYEGQKPLFKNVDFGIDMESRSKYAAFIKINLSCRTMTNALQSNNSCTCICLCIG